MSIIPLMRAVQNAEARGWSTSIEGPGVRFSTPGANHYQLTWSQMDGAPDRLYQSALAYLGEKEAAFDAKRDLYLQHMARFIVAHRGQPHGDTLIELERVERWEKVMGAIAAVLPPPVLED